MENEIEYQLKVEEVYLRFGGLVALNQVSIAVKKGEIFSVIGPNGAGKTCLLNCINRFYQPERGKIFYEGHDISHLKAHRIASLGIARTFQNVELFGHMSAMDNIKLGGHVHLKSGSLAGGIYYGKSKKEEMDFRKWIEERIIDLLEIEHIRKKTVHTLPYGLQKRVELGRALAMRPKILLLDEPATGMNLEEGVGFLNRLQETAAGDVHKLIVLGGGRADVDLLGGIDYPWRRIPAATVLAQ